MPLSLSHRPNKVCTTRTSCQHSLCAILRVCQLTCVKTDNVQALTLIFQRGKSIHHQHRRRHHHHQISSAPITQRPYVYYNVDVDAPINAAL